MNPCFSPASLRDLEPTMNRYYEQFLDGLQQRANKNGGFVEMTEWFHNLSFDVVLVDTLTNGKIAGALTLGVDFGALKTGQQHYFIKAIHGGLAFISLVLTRSSFQADRQVTPIIWLVPLLMLIPKPEGVENSRKLCFEVNLRLLKLAKRKFTQKAVSNCLEKDTAERHRTILASLQRVKDPETGGHLERIDVDTNANTLLYALL